MVRTCSVFRCNSQYHPRGNISFHVFPSDPVRRDLWIKAVKEGRKSEANFIPGKFSFLCSKHFSQECFNSFGGRYRSLKHDAIPSIFDCNPCKLVPSQQNIASTEDVPQMEILSTAAQGELTEQDNNSVTSNSSPVTAETNSIIMCSTADSSPTKSPLREPFKPRVCLSKSGKTYSTDAAILNVIHKLTDLDFRTDDLPQQICQKCLDKINEICEFSFQCIRSHSALIECLNQQKNPEPKEVEEETTNSEIFENLDRLKTEELKEEILDLEPDVIYNEYENQINEDEVNEETTRTSEIDESFNKLETEEPQEHNVKEVTTNNKIIESENKVSVNHDECPYKCGICCKAFITKSRLVQHGRLHSGERPYKSGQCSNLVMHNTVKRFHKCDQCAKYFTKPSALIQHKRIHSGERPYKCGLCSKTFNRQGNLVVHERIHSGERLYKCDQCPKCFIQKSNLKQHKSTHSGERPYKCSQCSKSFSQFGTMVEHKRTHSGERPYKCGLCSKTFAHSSALKRHKRIHTGEHPYKCDLCSKTFCQSTDLTSHKYIHSGERPYKCVLCLKTFTRKSHLVQHERNIHNGERL